MNSIKNLLLLIFSIFISVFLVELILRNFIIPIEKAYHFEPYTLINDSERGYKLKPNNISEHTNGFFNVSIKTDKYSNRDNLNKDFKNMGVVAIGDSQTFGNGLNQNQSWPEILQNKLSINIINTGVPGYSPQNYLPTIKEQIRNGINVKHILYAITYNDLFETDTLPNDRFVDSSGYLRSKKSNFSINSLVNIVRNRTAVGRLIENVIRTNFSMPIMYTKETHTLEIDKFIDFVVNFEKKLDHKNIKLHLVYIATGSHILKDTRKKIFSVRDYDYEFIGNYLDTRLKYLNINFIDATPYFFEYSKNLNFQRNSIMLPVDGHYNENANNIVAELFDKLLLE